MTRLAAAMACLFSVLGCEGGQPPVVVYVSADEQVARPVLAAFTARTGIPVKPLFDTEATKTTGLANRLRREADRPVADVFWSSEPFAVEQLAREGILASPQGEVLADHPSAWRHPEHRWYGFGGRARVIVYHPGRLAPEDVPTAWTDLAKGRFTDQVVMADPRFGTTRGHLGAMKVFWDQRAMPGYYTAWLEGLAENGVRMLPGGNAAVVDAVDRGEALVGMTDTDDVWAAQARGSEVQLVYPRHDLPGERGGGTLLVPNAAGLVHGAGNPDAGRALLEYLVSIDVERALHASNSHNIPLVTTLEIEPRYRVPDPMRLPIPLAAQAMDPAVAEAMQRLDPERIQSLRSPGPGRSLPSDPGDS
ncbi:MAG: extracellular solute-binding protein [Phycisphaerales bacterium]|nr:extracellular solute-binding protein [Phycisphaerales bacterium]